MMLRGGISALAVTMLLLLTSMPAVAMDMEEAMQWCDQYASEPLEGIWEFPDDGVAILIERESEHTYSATVVRTSVPSLIPGSRLATFTATPEARVYTMEFFTRSDAGRLHTPRKCKGTLTGDGRGLVCVATKKITFSFNPSALLPAFRSLIRMREDRSGQPPRGLIKIYPEGTGADRRNMLTL